MRILVTLGIAVIVSGGALGVLTLAGANTPVSAGGLPTSFGLPAMQPGDRAQYAVHGKPWGGWVGYADRSEPKGPAPEIDSTWTFEYKERALRPDGNGSLVTADVFTLRDSAYDLYKNATPRPRLEEFWLRADRTPLAQIDIASDGRYWIGSESNASKSDGSCKGAAACGKITTRTTARTDSTDIPCGFLNSLQGQQAMIRNASISLLGCRWMPIMGNATPDTLDGHPAIRFNRGWQEPRGISWLTGNSLWFVPNIPYPIQIDEGNRHMHLSGFTRGPKPAAEAGPAVPLPWVEVPRQPWGVDPTGPFPFPLSEAWTQAKQDDNGPLKPFIASHPKASIVAAAFRHYEYSGPALDSFLPGERVTSTAWAWDLLVADGQNGLGFDYVKTWTNRTLDTPAGPVAYPSGTIPYEAKPVSYSSGRSYPVSLTATRLPDRLPTPESLWARWKPYAETDGVSDPFPGYGFALVSEDEAWMAGIDCHGGSFWAGSVLQDYNKTRDSIHADDIWNSVCFTADGNTLSATTQTVSARPPDEASPSTPVVPQVFAATPVYASWPIPMAAVAEGGGAGFGVALLYYFWPGIRGALVGLFSRHSPSPAPVQSTRKAILNLVLRIPGIHYRQIVRELGISKSSAEHHLRVLVADGSLRAKETNKRRAYYAPDVEPVVPLSSLDRILAALGRPTTVTQIARETGLAPSTVSYHVGRLERMGRLRRNGHELSVV